MSTLQWNVTDSCQINTTSSWDKVFNNSVPLGCLEKQVQEFISWNNPDNIVSFAVESLVRNLKDLIFLPMLFLIGCPANIINMAVFYKQGLKERINICLFALSFADELYLINNMMWYGEQLHLHFTTKEIFGPVMRFMTNNNILGFYGLIWVSQFLYAIIASERCFCIMQPLRSQTILSTSTMTAIVLAVSVIIIGPFFIVATRYRIACVYDYVTNSIMMTTVQGNFFLRHQRLVEYLDVFVYGVGITVLTQVIVVTATILTVVKLHQAAAWRAGTSSSSGVSQREVALTRMLIWNSIFFIACSFPFVVFRIALLFLPEMNTGRRQQNFFLMCKWILISLSYVNSTFNIVIYYTTGSRYRKTFWQLFGGPPKKQKSINN